jgi:orotidine-5'-phosphate decarboxylase
VSEVIVAFDVAGRDEMLSLADRLPDLRWAKIGPMLFLRHGPAVIAELKDRGVKVFLDLKWHDIPHAVTGAVKAARELGVDLATVHALGGSEMLRAASQAAGPMRLAAVSVLTSHTPESYAEASGRGDVELHQEVSRLARIAVAAGLGAVVASPWELGTMRSAVPSGTWLVVPGIRPPGAELGDQRRTADPRAAAEAGATHLVVGRPIIRSDQPELVYQQICKAIA